NDVVIKNIQLGYLDGKKAICNLKGNAYYIEPIGEDLFFSVLEKIPKKLIYQIGKSLNIQNLSYKRIMFEYIVPAIINTLKLKQDSTYEDVVIALLEVEATRRNIDKLKIYRINEFIDEINSFIPVPRYKKEKNRYKFNLKPIVPGTINEELLEKLTFEMIKILKIDINL
ncbi:MAG: hypothetical protein IJH34_17225, partial [Romboutsia sp.]|nr:hypothetical protein [Romboutsia sp.]